MNLYLLTQEKNQGYDTYDSCVVCSKDEEDAKNIHPNGVDEGGSDDRFSTWTSSVNVNAKLIGKAAQGIKRGVVCSSFNAG